MVEVKEKKVIEITPVSKWKRILMFLGDYFITFILAFTLFNLAIFPLAKIITQSDKQIAKVHELSDTADNLLIEEGFVFKNPQGGDLEEHLKYTFKVFLSYYAFDEVDADSNNPQYGHKEENEVIKHYFLEYRNNESGYYTSFASVNEKDNMFNIDSGAKSITLKNDYKEILGSELLEVSDEDNYSTTMKNMRDNVFSMLFFKYVYQDILDNDYVKDGVSYNKTMDEAEKIIKRMQWIPSAASLITVVLSWGAVYLLYPMLNKDRRTPTMSAMRLSKLDVRDLLDIDRKKVAIESFYSLIFVSSIAIFLPLLYFGLAYCFNLPLLFIFFVISIFSMLVSMFFIFFNQYNRSGSDILVNNVVLPTSELDMLYYKQHNEDEVVEDGRE